MKLYVIVTGILWGIITILHVVRIVLESRRLATDPSYIVLTLITAGLCVWAIQLILRSRKSS